jgi:tetratricopeptide (TPR) repeat protein
LPRSRETPITGPGATVTTSGRLEAALARTGARLELSRQHYPGTLPPYHPARLTRQRPSSPADTPAELDGIPSPARGPRIAESLKQHLADCRAHAEAVLVHEELGELILNAPEREKLVCRALGILSPTEKDRLAELLTLSDLAPGHLACTTPDFLDAVAAIDDLVGHSTALTFGMLLVAGVRSPEQILEYATRVDLLFSRIISAPSVIRALDRAGRYLDAAGSSNGDTGRDSHFQVMFGILLAVRDRLWMLKPNRASTPFLLPQVIDNYLGPHQEVGNSLGLAIIDAAIISRLGFPVRYHIESDVVQLEIVTDKRSIYWEVVRPLPLSFVPVGHGRLVKLRDLFAVTHGSLATVYFNRGRTDRSIEHYERVLEITPDSAETCNCLGTCYIRKRMPEQAIKHIREALVRDPKSAEAHYNLGNAYALMEQWPRAIGSFKKAITLRPEYVEVYNNLGFAFQRSGSPEQAIASFEGALELRPDYVQAYFNLGNIHLELKQFDAAVEDYREAVRLQPNLAQAHYNMGQAHYGKKQLDHAINCYQKTIEINPKHFGAWHNLGIVYRDKGLKDKAVEALERAVTINPNLMR